MTSQHLAQLRRRHPEARVSAGRATQRLSLFARRYLDLQRICSAACC